MTRYEIVGELARAGRVEQIIRTVCKPWREELNDLAQMIYVILLEKDNGVVEQLWADGGINGSINFYLIRIVKNQHNTTHSTYRDLFSKYGKKVIEGDVEDNCYKQDSWSRTELERCGYDIRESEDGLPVHR